MEDAPTSQIVCPHCGHGFSLPLHPVELQLLRAVRKLERHNGAASTQAVALEVALSPSQTCRRLGQLEKKGQLKRIGTRRGWKVAA